MDPRVCRKLATRPAAFPAWSLRYDDPAEDASLQQALAGRQGHINLHGLPEQFVASFGATHGLASVSRTLLRSGDGVMVEGPGWAGSTL